MTKDDLQIGSPDWVTAKIELGQERIVQFVSGILESQPLATIGFYLVMLMMVPLVISNLGIILLNENDPNLAEYMNLIRMAALLIPVFLIPRVLIRTNDRGFLDIILSLILWALSFASYFYVWPGSITKLGFILPLVLIQFALPVVLFVVTRGLNFWLRFIILLIGVMAASNISQQHGYGLWLTLRSNMIFPISLLMLEQASGLIRSRTELVRYLFSPQQLFNPMPVGYEQRKVVEGSKRLYVLGTIDFIKAAAAISVGWLLTSPSISFDDSDFVSAVAHGYWFFFYFYVARFAWLSFFTGTARWLGFDMVDPVCLPILSANFFDFWKRWNFYLYNWANRLFVEPLSNKTRSLFLAVFIAYLLENFLMMSDRVAGSFQLILMVAIITVPIRAFLTALSAAAPGLFPSGRKWYGWFGVILVNLVVALMPGVRFYFFH